KKHPMTVGGKVPSRAARVASSSENQKKLYERWLKEQKKLRIQHVAGQFPHRLPTEARVAKWIAGQGWEQNVPSAAKVVAAWKPSGDLQDIPTSQAIRKNVSSQKWKGLVIAHMEKKGRGVMTTRKFHAGEVICDYRGELVTHEEGLRIHATTSQEETGYMFFFKNQAGKRLCIDAHLDRCACHPDRQTFRRLMNHSSKRANVKPRLFRLNFESGDRDVLLLMAARDTEEGQELMFDYSVQKHQFRGEGLDLEWLI
uniref:SET domain-containing protein n=1 Tax=Sphaeramia orbicularis TaxID=375764 RepID=A0A672ZB73_9TELE